MTGPRQERKLSGGTLAAIGLLLGMAATGATAGTSEWVVTNRHTGVAIDGFDPVAYFADRAPRQGRAGLELQMDGATFRFANEGNRTAFRADPAVYAPRFGGYDPLGVGRGVASPGHPELWQVVGDRLYLFHSEEALSEFARDPEQSIAAAERHWPALRRSLIRN